MANNPIKMQVTELPDSNSVRITTDIAKEARLVGEAIEARIVAKIADKFVEEHGDELIASIDMSKLGKQINGKILGAALRQLASDNGR